MEDIIAQLKQHTKSISQRFNDLKSLYELPSIIKIDDKWFIYVVDDGKSDWIEF